MDIGTVGLVGQSNFEFSGGENTAELNDCLADLLPLHDYKVLKVHGTCGRFVATIKCKVNTKDDVKKFINSYCEKTNEVLRKATTKPL